MDRSFSLHTQTTSGQHSDRKNHGQKQGCGACPTTGLDKWGETKEMILTLGAKQTNFWYIEDSRDYAAAKTVHTQHRANKLVFLQGRMIERSDWQPDRAGKLPCSTEPSNRC